jgi:hypothetical protein
MSASAIAFIKGAIGFNELVESGHDANQTNQTFGMFDNGVDIGSKTYLQNIVNLHSDFRAANTVNARTGNLGFNNSTPVDISTLLAAKGYVPGATSRVDITSGSGNWSAGTTITGYRGEANYTAKRVIVFLQGSGAGGQSGQASNGGHGGAGGGSLMAAIDWPGSGATAIYYSVGAGGAANSNGNDTFIGDSGTPTNYIKAQGGAFAANTGGGTAYNGTFFPNQSIILGKIGGAGGNGGNGGGQNNGANGGATNTNQDITYTPLTGQTLTIKGRTAGNNGKAWSSHITGAGSSAVTTYYGGGGGGGASGGLGADTYGYGGDGGSSGDGAGGGVNGYAATAGTGGRLVIYY